VGILDVELRTLVLASGTGAGSAFGWQGVMGYHMETYDSDDRCIGTS
jgi:hypothetical protein